MDGVTEADEHVQDLLGLYALNRLEGAELRRVEAHLPDCERCLDDLASIDGMPLLLDRIGPQDVAALRAAVVPASGNVTTLGAARRRRRPQTWKLAMVAAAVLIAIVGVGLFLVSPARTHDDPATLVAVASDATTGVSASVSVSSHAGGATVEATFQGVPAGGRYRFLAVSATGATLVVGQFPGDKPVRQLRGEVSVSADQISFFSLVDDAGGVLVSVPFKAAATPSRPG
jgi:anti-sigma factor RsiW